VYPLTAGDETIGALALYSSEVEAYSSDHLHLLESVSRLASTALQRAMLHEQTKTIAETDALTGLPNLRALYAYFDQELAEANRRVASLTVLSFNVIGLRAVNESYGYQAGDRMLAEVAWRLRHTVGDAGMLGRIAGDEFVCLFKERSCEAALQLGEQAQSRISSFRLEVRPDQFASVGLGFGVAESLTDGQSIDELLHAAAQQTRQNKTSLVAVPQQHVVTVPYSQRGKTGPLTLVG